MTGCNPLKQAILQGALVSSKYNRHSINVDSRMKYYTKLFSPNLLYKVIFVKYLLPTMKIIKTEHIKVISSTEPQNLRANIQSLQPDPLSVTWGTHGYRIAHKSTPFPDSWRWLPADIQQTFDFDDCFSSATFPAKGHLKVPEHSTPGISTCSVGQLQSLCQNVFPG